MPDIFGAKIAQEINKALGPLVFDQVLIKTSSTRDPADSTKRVKTKVQHPCKGFIDTYKDQFINGTLVHDSGRKVVILGASLPAGIIPEPGDMITAEGKNHTIAKEGVTRDPASATYECRAK